LSFAIERTRREAYDNTTGSTARNVLSVALSISSVPFQTWEASLPEVPAADTSNAEVSDKEKAWFFQFYVTGVH
jgi:hypothetical protein